MRALSLPIAILAGGLIAGVLDLVFALCFGAWNGIAPMRLLQAIASGALGAGAFESGGTGATLGVLYHFVLSLLWAGLFALVARRFPRLVWRPLATSLVFGAVVFLAMRLVVLPLSAYPFPVRFELLATVMDGASHVLLFALPIVLATRLALPGRAALPSG